MAAVSARTPAPGDRHVAMIVSYRGTGYAGFQRQPGRDTVQARLEQALADLAGGRVDVRAAGRTDAGVHAAGQVVDAWLPARVGLPLSRLPQALAARLPSDVVVAGAWPVAAEFHARRHAHAKRYRYLVWRRRVPSPFWAPYAWHHHGPLDVAAMAEAAARLVGRRDLRAFAGSARPVRDATRTVFDCRVWAQGPWLAIELEADGFLYRTVRSVAGTLWRVGAGALRPDDVEAVVARGDRAAAGPTLPAHGLCLLYVRYGAQWGLPSPDADAWPPPPGPSAPPPPSVPPPPADAEVRQRPADEHRQQAQAEGQRAQASRRRGDPGVGEVTDGVPGPPQAD